MPYPPSAISVPLTLPLPKNPTHPPPPPQPTNQLTPTLHPPHLRLFPYQVASSSLAILFLILILILISQRMLLPGIIVLGSFILFVLWLTGLIETSIQLFGPSGSVNGNCQLYVTGQPFTGVSINTLAWLEQNNICKWGCFLFFAVGGWGGRARFGWGLCV